MVNYNNVISNVDDNFYVIKNIEKMMLIFFRCGVYIKGELSLVVFFLGIVYSG